MSFSFDGMSNFRDAFLHKTIALELMYYTQKPQGGPLLLGKQQGILCTFLNF